MKPIFIISFLLSLSFGLKAEIPSTIAYQAVVRDAQGILLKETSIGLKISIVKGSVGGNVMYSESHSLKTNAQGLINAEIGTGTVLKGAMETIEWSMDKYFVKTEIDLSGGSTYTLESTQQLLSVPYSFYAKNTDTAKFALNANVRVTELPILKEAKISLLNNYRNGDTAISLSSTIISNLAGINVSERGFCWAETPFPSISGNKQADIYEGAGEMNVLVPNRNFTSGSTYYIRAYATNAVGTAYSKAIPFTYREFAKLRFDSLYKINGRSVEAFAVIESNGSDPIQKYGFCWSTNPNPTIESQHNEVNDDYVGKFNFKILGLDTNTKYYVRAYAINGQGINYSNEFIFMTLDHEYGFMSDIDGNMYRTIKIGNQTWMAQDLKVTQYRDGTPLPKVEDNVAWMSNRSGAYCYFNNIDGNRDKYGALYNWYACANAKKLCPEGWHVPNQVEIDVLRELVYSDSRPITAKGTKEDGRGLWEASPVIATNATGFSAQPSGYRFEANFHSEGREVGFWTLSQHPQIYGCGYAITLRNTQGWISYTFDWKAETGMSVRCLKD